MTGSVYIWAYIISQNWDVYAPGFTSLASNVEYVESETEFDLNRPDDDEQSKQPSEPAAVRSSLCMHEVLHILEQL